MSERPEPVDEILVRDLEVRFRVGVTEDERAQPQSLAVSLAMGVDIRAAAAKDDIEKTVDYYAVTRRVIAMGRSQSWRLIETLAEDIAAMILTEFRPRWTEVLIKKFILPDARYVAVKIRRNAAD